jgi:hyperosmotically inducible protein
MQQILRQTTLVLSALLAAASLTGCVAGSTQPAASGGGATRVARVQPQDSTLTSLVQTRLNQQMHAASTGVSVTTTNGIVQLNGSVPTTQHRAAMQKLAASVDGVQGVQNNLTIVPKEKQSAKDKAKAKREQSQTQQVQQ